MRGECLHSCHSPSPRGAEGTRLRCHEGGSAMKVTRGKNPESRPWQAGREGGFQLLLELRLL